jgi:ferredoxin
VLSAPNVFTQDDTEGAVLVLLSNPPESERQAVLEAVKRCPTQAIKLIED